MDVPPQFDEICWQIIRTSNILRPGELANDRLSHTGVPVLPWFSELNETKPWAIPSFATRASALDAPELPYVQDLGQPWANV